MYNLELKTRPKLISGSIPIDIALPAMEVNVQTSQWYCYGLIMPCSIILSGKCCNYFLQTKEGPVL
jgi:hypothetical protein